MKHRRHPCRASQGLRSVPLRLLTVLFLLTVAALMAACSANNAPGGASSREATLRRIATEYARTGDLKQAQASLDKLNVANPAQLLLAVAESDVSAGRSREDIAATARLAEMLGARSPKVAAYLTPSPVPAQVAEAATAAPTVLAATLAVPTLAPSSPTVAPPTAAPTATAAPATATAVPPTNSPTPEPQNPRVLAGNSVNLRGGPGTGYPVVARLRAGQEAPIVGRNASGDWWQVEMPGVKQAWVAGTVVKVLGAIDTVEVAKNIPPLPTAAPKPTAVPQPVAAPQPTAAPAGPHFKLTVRRLWTVEETGGFLAGGISVNCGGRHSLHVYVKDAAGNLLDGVTIKEAGGVQQELVSGSKASGMAEFDLYPPGKDVYIVRDVDGRQATSDTGAAPSVVVGIPYDFLRSGHYCTTDEDCAHHVSQNGCSGHYSWDLEFQRNY